ncbi:hypothetical protein BpOF4_09475 [Alkalihalophilus pseudofirmus OF4]|uniref:Uncharacterized protein n=2 Tax=Alkalihalophilus pseudofirmus TaxID=79885 RepID=D3FSI2_ALKPO|nr:hypothetical protein [Alkalihalophilus pseudofirmus]AAB87741.1 hypothetical 8.9 kDa protein [Alkalihalophilus pseudofirmus OF4]ADC49950.1 hypothetical protein BpOF4_09475 [Alkalihalophilus pseudofirmus OF4]WEG17260.1 hypothetical protein PQ478_01740 [Alkalihalophilus pseudofirmus]
MSKDKQSIVKSIHAAFIVGKIMTIVFGLLIAIIFISDPSSKTPEEWIVIVFSLLVVSIGPLTILHLVHHKVFLKKYPEIKQK